MDDYRQFLERKIKLAEPSGLDCGPLEVNTLLKPHQRAMVQWAVAGGRRAIFASFGLGKTVIQLEILRLILGTTGGRGLIVLPLGVRQEFIRDAAMLGTPVKFIRRIEEADATGIHLTNYETVRDGVWYVEAAAAEAAVPTLFDLMEAEASAPAEAAE
jgi:hypothetical protein